MSTPPRLLDLFCGAGGAAMGYHRAGFEVVGVDLHPQPNYPFEFHQADAMTYPLDGFDAIHASPPCQLYSIANNAHGRDNYPDLADAIRQRLQVSGVSWVIENVPGSPLRNYSVLCGLTFGLNVKRHRWFESNVMIMTPPCPGHNSEYLHIFGLGAYRRANQPERNMSYADLKEGQAAMGIDWMTKKELSQAIPPVYTEFIGSQLLDHMAANV